MVHHFQSFRIVRLAFIHYCKQSHLETEHKALYPSFVKNIYLEHAIRSKKCDVMKNSIQGNIQAKEKRKTQNHLSVYKVEKFDFGPSLF